MLCFDSMYIVQPTLHVYLMLLAPNPKSHYILTFFACGLLSGIPLKLLFTTFQTWGQPRCGCVLSGWLPNEEGWTAHACTCCNVPTFACGLVLGIPHSTFYFYLYHYFCLRASLVVSTLVTDVEVVKVCPCGIFRLESSFLSWYSYLGWLSRCT